MGRKKTKMPEKTNINFQVDVECAKRLMSEAHRQERSLSSMIRFVMKKYMEQQEKKEERRKT